MHQIAKVLEFCFSISPSNEYSGLISFRIDWFYLLAVQGTCKSLLQHHSLKATVLWLSAFFIVQLSQPYMTTGRTISLTLSTFVGKVISLLFNMLLRFFIAFLFFFFNFHFYFILLYNTVLVLSYIDMNPPRVYMHSQT